MMESERLIIKPLEEKYVQDVCALERSLLGSGDEQAILKTISDKFLKYYVLTKDAEVVGFLEGKIVVEEAELYDICISKSEQGKGYSKMLMEYFVGRAMVAGCNTIFLEVNTMNYKAISLYRKFGFVDYGTRKNYYGDSDAVLMKKELK